MTNRRGGDRSVMQAFNACHNWFLCSLIGLAGEYVGRLAAGSVGATIAEFRSGPPADNGLVESLSLPGPTTQKSGLERSATDNRLVGSSSPPSPTTHSRSNGDFLS